MERSKNVAQAKAPRQGGLTAGQLGALGQGVIQRAEAEIERGVTEGQFAELWS